MATGAHVPAGRRAGGGGGGAFVSVGGGTRSGPYPSAAARGRRGYNLTPDEVDKLMALESELETLRGEIADLESMRRDRKSKDRDQLDACKAEVRGAPLNTAALEETRLCSQRRVEEIKVLLMGQIADDKHKLAEVEDDAAAAAEHAALDVLLAEATEKHATARAAYEAARARGAEAAEAAESKLARIEAVEAEVAQLDAHSTKLEADQQMRLRERDEASVRMQGAKRGAEAVISKQKAMDQEVRTATSERTRMQARVNSLSNKIKTHVLHTAPFAGVPALATTPATEFSIPNGTNPDRPYAFSLSSVVSTPEELAAQTQSEGTTRSSSAELLVVTPAAHTFEPFPAAQAVVEAKVASLPPSDVLTVQVAEIFGEAVRDLTVDDPAYHDRAIAACDKGVLSDCASVRLHAHGELSAVLQQAVARLLLRQRRAPLCAPQNLVVVVDACPSAVTFLFTAGRPPVLDAVGRLASDPRDAKAILRRSPLGRVALPHLSGGSAVAVCAATTAETKAEAAVELCRTLHKLSHVDLGVKIDK
eukprot:Rhum_TRINITY_DN14480_c32_g1::Rhum_TRINITY_DN14480_c32_g1_i1::g.92878::m.92878